MKKIKWQPVFYCSTFAADKSKTITKSDTFNINVNKKNVDCELITAKQRQERKDAVFAKFGIYSSHSKLPTDNGNDKKPKLYTLKIGNTRVLLE